MNRRGFFALLAGALAAPHLPAPTPAVSFTAPGVTGLAKLGVDVASGPDRVGYAVFMDGRLIGRVTHDDITINEDVRMAG